jgi:hypothetical protein
MKLDQLANAANYQLSGGLTISSATMLDPTTVRLATSKQTMATRYTVTLNNVEDIAGNKIAANTSKSFNAFSVQTGTVGLEVWNDITGDPVSDLRGNARYPNQPSADYVTTTLNSLLVIPATPDKNTYGGRLRAWLTPDVSGDYEFFLRADTQGELRISTDDKFDNLDDPNGTPDATDTTIGDTFQESGVDNSTSVPISLVKGKKYAIQVLWKESNGTDYAQVAWRRVGDTTPADQLQPIPSQFLSYYGPGAALPEPGQITRIVLQGGKVILEWTGGTALQSSDDLVSWKDETGATSPLSITPAQKKFYRIKN